jgi:hypothetical protein
MGESLRTAGARALRPKRHRRYDQSRSIPRRETRTPAQVCLEPVELATQFPMRVGQLQAERDGTVAVVGSH